MGPLAKDIRCDCGIWVAPFCCPKTPEFELTGAGVLVRSCGNAEAAEIAESMPQCSAWLLELLDVDAVFVRDVEGLVRAVCRAACSAVARRLEGENAAAARLPVDTQFRS